MTSLAPSSSKLRDLKISTSVRHRSIRSTLDLTDLCSFYHHLFGVVIRTSKLFNYVHVYRPRHRNSFENFGKQIPLVWVSSHDFFHITVSLNINQPNAWAVGPHWARALLMSRVYCKAIFPLITFITGDARMNYTDKGTFISAFVSRICEL